MFVVYLGPMSSPVEKFKNASWGRRFVWLGIAVVGLLVVIQLVPYGRDHSNPPVASTPQWQGKNTQQLFSTSCGDCHSNLTDWRWYSNVAPASWLVQQDVDEGRSTFNVSEWDSQPQPDLDEIDEVISSGEMPPLKYTVIHGDAKLSDAEKQQLIDGLTATYAQSPPASTD